MLGIVEALKKQSDKTLNEFGADIALVSLKKGLAPADMNDRLKIEFGANNISSINAYYIFVRETDTTLKVHATDEYLFKLRPYLKLEGRALDRLDLKHAERNCVISKALSHKYSLNLHDAIHLRDQTFTIVGIIHSFQESDALVYIPKTCKALWSNQLSAHEGSADQFIIKSAGASELIFKEKLQQQFAENKALHDQLSITTAGVLLKGVNTLSRIVKITAGGIAILCILYGCLSLGSLMMTNVRARVSEIGLRRALGANTAEITSLFMSESLSLCISAALIATLIGNLAFYFLPSLFQLALQPSLSTLTLPLIIAIVSGSIAAYYPAKYAARIRPSDALRL